MNAPDWLPTQPEQTIWDVVIVGTGMGGATLGYALAAAVSPFVSLDVRQTWWGSPHVWWAWFGGCLFVAGAVMAILVWFERIWRE